MKEFIINQNDAGQRIDKFITKAMPELPKSMMYRLIRKKDIKLNGKRCGISDIISEGDVIRVYVKDEVSAVKQHDEAFLNAPSEIDTVYEDGNIIVVFKPAGLDSHANGETHTDTLINRIKHYLYNKGEYVPDNESSFAPALCSRLDRNTSGIVTAAKNAAALREMNEAIRSGAVHKVYHCLTVSPLPEKEAIITAYHRKDEGRNIVRISDKPMEGYKEIRTGYKVLSSKNGLYLTEVTLYTGRTHQIRAHLAHIGSPLLGDGKYGDTAANKRYGVFRQALSACELRFSFEEGTLLSYLNNKTIKGPAAEFEKMVKQP